jgi:predicted 2-oxoglutarate/Fe(II)-dependent dioxygenase YbiX
LKLTDYILKKNILSKLFCEKIVEEIKNKKWEKHSWYNSETEISHNKKEDAEILAISEELQNKFDPFIFQFFKEYCEKFSFDKNLFVHKYSPIRFNKYSEGAYMAYHYDHIHSLFDGVDKGVPVLSCVGNLNENYVGGNLIICGQPMNLKTGDVCIFPSCFLYPHEVTKVEKDIRYSFVNWAF